MPFTPFHMGPGIVIKALLQTSFSLMVFGWSQIIMDLQPLWVMIQGHGHVHGFSHTYVGATLLAVFSGVTGKYLSEIGLKLIVHRRSATHIRWTVALASSFIGTYSHVLLDSVMHADVQPFFPISLDNPFLLWLSVSALHTFCLSSAFIGGILYAIVYAISNHKQ